MVKSAFQFELIFEFHRGETAIDSIDQRIIPNSPSSAHPLFTLLRYRLRSVVHTLYGVRRESRLKIVVVSVAGLMFWLGLFWSFMHGFRFVFDNTGPLLGTKLVHYGFGLFCMSLTVMLTFSNALISFTNLFQSNETANLFSLPIKRETIFIYKLFESMLYSSWAVFALGLPLALALGIQTKAAWQFYPACIIMAVPFVILPAGMGTVIGLLLTTYLPRNKTKILVLAGFGVLCIAVASAFGIFHSGKAMLGKSLDVMLNSALANLSFTRHYMSPNYWMAEGLLRVSEGHPDALRVCGIFFAALTTSAMFFVALGWFLSGSIYARAFSDSHGMGNRAKRGRVSPIDIIFGPFLAGNPAMAALMMKDIKTFFRDPAQWAQVLIFFGILLIYNVNIQNLASYNVEQPMYKNLTSFLNLGAASMTLATICSRFIFPMISLEGQRFWILGLAPIARRQIMWSKFFFAFGGTALISVPLSAISNWSQNNPPLVAAVQVWTSLLIAFGLSGLTVGMGALFPDFKQRDPSKIVSGFGGTLTLIISIGLVAASVGGGGLLFHRFFVMPQLDGMIWHPANDLVWAVPFLAFITILNLSAGLIPMTLGVRALEEVEF
ncbi:MAG: hypothetical protein WCT04_16745 [Planctomycetota bacterium]